MALPKLDLPKYSITLFDGTVIKFKPFTVKEEKILMIAIESEKNDEIVEALFRVIENCVDEEINIRKRPLSDVWHIFLNIRAKSKGEVVELNVLCNDCAANNTISSDITKAAISKNKEVSNIVKINDTVGLTLKYPSLKDVMSADEGTESQFNIIASCIESIYDGETIHNSRDNTKEEISEFLDSCKTDVLEKIKDYLDSAPELILRLKFKCASCAKDQDLEVKDFNSFLE
jgi:hypothetical protein